MIALRETPTDAAELYAISRAASCVLVRAATVFGRYPIDIHPGCCLRERLGGTGSPAQPDSWRRPARLRGLRSAAQSPLQPRCKKLSSHTGSLEALPTLEPEKRLPEYREVNPDPVDG